VRSRSTRDFLAQAPARLLAERAQLLQGLAILADGAAHGRVHLHELVHEVLLLGRARILLGEFLEAEAEPRVLGADLLGDEAARGRGPLGLGLEHPAHVHLHELDVERHEEDLGVGRDAAQLADVALGSGGGAAARKGNGCSRGGKPPNNDAHRVPPWAAREGWNSYRCSG
jgi:hypothetical protein